MEEKYVEVGAVSVNVRHIHGAWFLEKDLTTMLVRLWSGERYYTSDPEQIDAILAALDQRDRKR